HTPQQSAGRRAGSCRIRSFPSAYSSDARTRPKAPSSAKAWVDYLIAPGLSIDPETHVGLLGGRYFVVLASRGGGYGAGTPREGWDHAEAWLPHGLALTGLEPRLHHGRAHTRRDKPGHGRPDPAGRQEPCGGRASDR